MQQQNTFWFFAWRWNFSAVSSSSSSVYSWHCVLTLWFLRSPSATGLNILCAGLYSMTLKCLSLQWMSGLQRSPGDVTYIMEVLACKNFLNEQPLWLLLCPLNKTPANLALTKKFCCKITLLLLVCKWGGLTLCCEGGLNWVETLSLSFNHLKAFYSILKSFLV